MFIRILNIELYDVNWIPYSTANLNLFVFDKKNKTKKNLLHGNLEFSLYGKNPIVCYECLWIHSGLEFSLTLKAPRKTASENVVCLCRLLNILADFSNLFLHTGKQCGP